MAVFVLKRLAHAIVVLLCMVFVLSMLIRLIPGDPVDIMSAGNPGITEEQKEALREQLGLTQPPVERFFAYLGGVLRGDLGESLRFRTPALDLVMERLPATLELTVLSMLLAVTLAIPIGVVTALRQGRASDYAGSLFAILGVSVPSFLLGIVLILYFSVDMNLLPASGRGEPLLPSIGAALGGGGAADLIDSLRHLILPVVALALSVMAWNARLTRSAMLEVMRQDYVQFARAKGLPRRVVVMHHALRNALIPTITIVGLQVGYLLSGSFVIENVFAWPGIGRLAVQAIFWRDYPVIQAVVLVTATLFLLINIVVDLVYRWADPRIRYVRG